VAKCIKRGLSNSSLDSVHEAAPQRKHAVHDLNQRTPRRTLTFDQAEKIYIKSQDLLLQTLREDPQKMNTFTSYIPPNANELRIFRKQRKPRQG
jgi:hypothetical protein